MATETGSTDDLLTLTQWLSPAFPVSGYAYSHGLETAIAEGHVTTADDLCDWIVTVLARGSGHNDAVLLVHAMRGGAPELLADIARALASSAERRRETDEQGAAFARTLVAMGHDVPVVPYPVAVGIAARGLDLPPGTVARHYLQSFAAQLVSAAVRFMPLGQAKGQAVLAALRPVIVEAAEIADRAGLDDLGGAALGADLAAALHETQEVRIFRT